MLTILGITLGIAYLVISFCLLVLFYYMETVEESRFNEIAWVEHLQMIGVAVGWFPMLIYVGYKKLVGWLSGRKHRS